MYRPHTFVGINTSCPQPFLHTIFPVSKRLHPFHPHCEHAAQVLHRLSHASYPWQGVQSLQEGSSTHQWTTFTSRTCPPLLAGTWQPVYMGTHPNIRGKSRLSQSRNGHHPRMATQTQLPPHLPILSPQERHSQETCLEHKRSVWSGHVMASSKTQVHSNTCSSDIDSHQNGSKIAWDFGPSSAP